MVCLTKRKETGLENQRVESYIVNGPDSLNEGPPFREKNSNTTFSKLCVKEKTEKVGHGGFSDKSKDIDLSYHSPAVIEESESFFCGVDSELLGRVDNKITL